MIWKKYKYLILLSVLVILSILSIGNTSFNPNIKYGIPFNSDIIINKSQYVIGYNKTNNTADWVSWELNKSWLGDAKRNNVFISDNSLPINYTKITSNDYTNSGYDRGHMTNSEDRTNSQINNNATFVLSNILPQKADNNRGPWKYLEEFCRQYIKNDSNYSLYIVSGPIGSLGKIKNKLNIPNSFYKTVLIEYKGKPIKGFAVIIPNINGIINNNWKNYIVSIRNVETITKYNFYSNLDKKTQDLIELTSNY